MVCGARGDSSTDDEINAAVDSILAEDRGEKLVRKRRRDEPQQPQCSNNNKRRNPPGREPACRQRGGCSGVNSSHRFSVRVTEALRALERRKEQGGGCAARCSTTCEIVDYVANNFTVDGDVDAQVRTALKRTCCQGFVKDEGNDTYRLVGPYACSLARTADENLRQATPASTAPDDDDGDDAAGCGGAGACGREDRRGSDDGDEASREPTQESSEIDLSIPSSAAADLFRRKIECDMSRMENNGRASDVSEALNRTIDSNSDILRQQRRRMRRNEAVDIGPRSKSTPRKGSARAQLGSMRNAESSEAVVPGMDLTPEFVDDGDDDDDDYSDIVVPDETAPLHQDDVDAANGDDDDGAGSDDSALREIRGGKAVRRDDDARDKELKRWIGNCRKECERRAREMAKE